MDERDFGRSLGYSPRPGAIRGFHDENGRPLRRHRNGITVLQHVCHYWRGQNAPSPLYWQWMIYFWGCELSQLGFGGEKE